MKQSGLICLEVVSRINNIDFDARAIVREYGITDRELAPEELQRIAKQVGFRVKAKVLPVEQIADRYPLPAIVCLKDKSYAVLLGANIHDGKVLLFIPDEKIAKPLSLEEFRPLSSGTFIILHHRALSPDARFGLHWFYREILKYRPIIAEVLLGSFVVQLFGFVTPLFTQVILDKVLVHHSMTTLNVLLVAFLAVTLFELLLNISRNYIFIHTSSKIDARLGAKLFKHLITLPFIYFESRKVGNIAARVRELDTIRDFITHKSISVIIDLFFSLVFVVMMTLYSVKLTLLVCAFVSALAILYVTITPELRRRLEKKFLMGAQSNAYLVESVTGMETVKSLSIEGSMQKRWEDTLGKYVQASFKLSNMSNIAGSLAGALQKLMTILILYFGVLLVIDKKMTVGQLIAFQMFAGQFTGPILRLANLWNEFQQALLSVDRIGDILNHPLEVPATKPITLPKLQGAVRFENVNFRYSPGAPSVLNDVSLAIEPQMSIGIVGKSGSGKSTLSKLIQRLYIPTEGAIYVDGIDIRHLNPFWLRHNIGVVLQENYLFSGTIRENISLPQPDAPMELIIKVSTLAGAHEFISQLPEGYDTVVGERGSTLSGGQKQRIAIARALITNPQVLIFDEATSALDYESEMIIRKNLIQIRQGRTVFIISHKLANVRGCDQIIAMDRGKIIEAGTHDMLLARNGYYRHLYELQEESP